MTSFLDKLKKGMNVENLPEIKENSEPKKDPSFDKLPEEESRLQRDKSRLQRDKEGKIEETPKKISPVLAETIATANSSGTGIKERKRKKVVRNKPRQKQEKTEKIKNVKQKKTKKIKIKEVSRLKMDKPIESEKNKEEKWLESVHQSRSFAKERDLGGQEGELTVDVYQTDEDLVIQSVIAGITPENLNISIENDMVIIRGNREKPTEKEKRNYFFQECYWGPFSRELVLPEEVDNSRIQASLKNGVLTIRIPKIEREKKRKVSVEE